MGKEAAVAHVPRWLPCFPDSWQARNTENGEEESTIAAEVVNGSSERDHTESDKRLGSGFDPGLNLLEKRDKIRFTIEFSSVSVGRKRRKNCDLAVD